MKSVKKMEEKKASVLIWFLKMVSYGVILIIISYLFPNIVYIDSSLFGLWALLTAVLVAIMNQTIKPVIFWLTVPITGITLGLFYPFINLIILKLVSLIMLGHFEIYGIFYALLVSILISILNILIDYVILKIIRKG